MDNQNRTELSELVNRILAGNTDAEDEVVRRYEKGVALIIRRIVRSASAADDVSQDTFKKILEKIRLGEVREPERLSGFICSVARNSAIEYIRRARKLVSQEDAAAAEHVPDPAPSQLDEVLRDEKSRLVHQIINELKIERDRELLRRYYIAEEDKDRICAALRLTRAQFNNVISRSKARFKDLYKQRFGPPDG